MGDSTGVSYPGDGSLLTLCLACSLPEGVQMPPCVGLGGEKTLAAPSVLRRIFFIFILLIICRFYTASEIHVGITIVQTLTIDTLTFLIKSSNHIEK